MLPSPISQSNGSITPTSSRPRDSANSNNLWGRNANTPPMPVRNGFQARPTLLSELKSIGEWVAFRTHLLDTWVRYTPHLARGNRRRRVNQMHLLPSPISSYTLQCRENLQSLYVFALLPSPRQDTPKRGALFRRIASRVEVWERNEATVVMRRLLER